MLLKLHEKLAPGWVLIQVNFDPIQEIGPKVGGGHSFMSVFLRDYSKYIYRKIKCPIGGVRVGQIPALILAVK